LFVGSVSFELSSADNLYEDLHWLLLISGYLLADEGTGETPLIPQEIISYSSNLKSQVDIQATFQTLCASQNQNQGECYGGICFTTLLSLWVKIECAVWISAEYRNYLNRLQSLFAIIICQHTAKRVFCRGGLLVLCRLVLFQFLLVLLVPIPSCLSFLIFERRTYCKQCIEKITLLESTAPFKCFLWIVH